MRTPGQARALVVVVRCLELLNVSGTINSWIDCFLGLRYIASADLGMEPRPIEPTYLNSNARFETSALADNLEWYPPLVSA